MVHGCSLPKLENNENVTAIYFERRQCNGTTGTQINLQKYGENIDSLSICFRFVIKKWWSYFNLIQTPNVFMTFETFSYLHLHLFFQSYSQRSINWTNALSLSSSSWNSLCFTHNSTLNRNKLYLNGLLLADFSGETIKGVGKVNMSYVEIGQHGSIEGYFTDIFIWNVALTENEILKYLFQNLSTSLLNPQAQVLKWSDAKIMANSSCTSLAQIKTKHMSIYNALIGRKYYFTSWSGDFEYAQKFCGMINGQIFYPENTEQLQLVLKEKKQIDHMGCSSSMWTPFKKGNIYSMNWEFGKRWNKKHRHLFDPWILNNTQDGQCLYLNFSTKVLQQSDCTKHFCAVCEITKERLFYTLQSEFNRYDEQPERNYILSQEDGTIFFTGIDGLWEIKYNSIYKSQYKDDLTIFASYYYAEGMVGLQKWQVGNSVGKNLSLIKLTNVS